MALLQLTSSTVHDRPSTSSLVSFSLNHSSELSNKRRCVADHVQSRNIQSTRLRAATLHERPIQPPISQQPRQEIDSKAENAQFDWHAHWYAVGFVGCIWKDGTGQWQAFLDCCPHRLVPLSEGRITATGQLQCGYHGWNFNSSGKCTAIPQGGNMNNPRTCAKVYQCAVSQDILWVKPQQSAPGAGLPDASDIPSLPEIDAGWIDSSTFRDLPYDYATLIENLVDTGHVPFTHHASVSLRSSADELKLDVTKRGPWGFVGRNERGPRKGQLGAQDTEFRAPCLMRSTIDAQATKGFSNITCVYAIPTVPGRCRAIVRNVFLFKSPVPRFVFKVLPKVFTHLGNNNVLEDDVIFLHKQEELAVQRGLGTKPAAQVYHLPGQSDNFVTAFRAWLQKYGGGGPWGPMDASWLQAAGPRLSKQQLLERYESHTAHCQVCQTALGRVRLARQALRHTTTALFVLAASLAAVALATAHSGPGIGLTDAENTVGNMGMGFGGKKLIVGTLMMAGSEIVKFMCGLLPSSSPSIRMATALGIALVAGAIGLVQRRLAKLEGSFYQGTWPPPRNTQKTSDEAIA